MLLPPNIGTLKHHTALFVAPSILSKLLHTPLTLSSSFLYASPHQGVTSLRSDSSPDNLLVIDSDRCGPSALSASEMFG